MVLEEVNLNPHKKSWLFEGTWRISKGIGGIGIGISYKYTYTYFYLYMNIDHIYLRTETWNAWQFSKISI